MTASIATPPIPQELAGPLPRKTRLSPNGTLLALSTAILFAIAVACAFRAFTLAIPQVQKRAALRRGGTETIGTIQSFSGSSIDYAFTVNGNSYTGQARLPEHIANVNLFEDYRSGRSIPIRYIPEKPSINHPAAWEWPVLEDLGWFFGAAVPGAFGALFTVFLLRDKQLVANGTPIAAVVTECNQTPRWGLVTRYEFRREDGELARGSYSFSAEQEVGACIWVLYLPQNPKRFQAYSGLSYAIAL